MKKIIIFSMMAAFFAFGCQEYEVQFEGPYEDPETGTGNQVDLIYELVYAQGNEVNMLDFSLTQQKNLAVFSAPVKLVSINYAHDRVAVLTEVNDIRILDTTGVIIESVPNSSDVIWFDWHSNGETLYMLGNDMKLRFHGPAVQVPMTDLELVFPPFVQEKRINSVGIGPGGTLIFGYRYYESNLFYRSKIHVRSNNGSPSGMDRNLESFHQVKYIRLWEDGARALMGIGQTFLNEVYRYSFLTGQLTLISNEQMSAVSPDGEHIAIWDGSRIYSTTNFDNGFNTGFEEVVSMDW